MVKGLGQHCQSRLIDRDPGYVRSSEYFIEVTSLGIHMYSTMHQWQGHIRARVALAHPE